MEKKQQFSIWYLFAALLLIVALQDYLAPPHVDNLPYSDFKSFLRSGKITEVALGEAVITGTLSNDGAGEDLSPKTAERLATLSKGPHPFTTVRVDDRALVGDLEAAKVPFAGRVESKWLPALLSWVIPALVFFALWSFLIKRMAGSQGMGGFMSVGKSKAKVYMETDTKVTFDDVAGVDEAKEELQEVIGFLKDPARYGRLGGRVPKGVLLVGPPGTGKTLLARAVAGQAGVPFFSISGSEFVEMFVGVGAARVRDLFEQARKQAPAIIFIDELDALGRARGAYPMGGHDEKEQTLNQLLSEMDGFDTSAGVVLLAATNRPEILDPALLRAGRFDRQVLVDRPDRKGRVQILDVHLKKVKLASDADPEKIAALTPGFSGADLANLVNEAALLATRRGADAAGLDDFTAAIERIVAGLEKRNRLLNPLERKVVAYHEMGHALVALSLPGVDRVHKISIIPRGIGALGYTIQRPTEDRFLMTREELESKMAVLLGGRASEHLAFGHLSTGAADDLAKATDIARSMVMRYGMEAKLGHVSYEGEGSRFLDVPQAMNRRHEFSEEVAREIDRAVKAILDAAFENATQVLAEQRSILDRGAALLLEKETLNEENLRELTGAAGSRESAEQPVRVADVTQM
ncbi:MAG: ATP-dependent metallopeptidase FtsH/Yme1/Tma family protein [Lautropia sp.]|jgi:cell division protease FtsH|nr:MAG: ATP-dependent metallopeptidase FtsH/Yme1/Tma family protein [Pseudomonadota bacterium]MBC6958588.1 ATP-dependent metallopeptidase FtsH/Yme1/Tma family protein [Lautropia sp.]MBW7925263.1 ATP-dependent zinc metalloprotease FtsH [Burkholderiaceae bacterium]MCZ2413763.1 ATP-dependent zinc metalloprotease FtsH [Burkholderiales bacterium]MDL1907032.1 ATP-dependent zinc metalloprotease FtsH [Betaproteobacteria bacterium PRO1]